MVVDSRRIDVLHERYNRGHSQQRKLQFNMCHLNKLQKLDLYTELIMQLNEINGEFVIFLEKKIDACHDMEERVGLTSLKGRHDE